MQEMKPVKEGKVREIYDNGDSLIMVATDRISCFDVILNNEVTKKGTVLTQMSKFWFDMTQDILPNHMISVDVKDMPDQVKAKLYLVLGRAYMQVGQHELAKTHLETAISFNENCGGKTNLKQVLKYLETQGETPP